MGEALNRWQVENFATFNQFVVTFRIR